MKWLQKILKASSSHSRQLRDDRGTVALMLGLSLVPITIAVGAAMDYGSHTNVLSKLQAATDSAVLAVATDFEKSQGDMQRLADKYFVTNYDANGPQPTAVVAKGSECVTVTGSVEVPNSFMKLVVGEKSTVHATAEACMATTGMELVLVFDNTGSMGNYGRLSALKTAATHLTNILFGANTKTTALKIGIVPFSQAVNVGVNNANQPWLDTNGEASYSRINFQQGWQHNWRAWQEVANRDWNGCVEARKGALAVDDTPPTSGDTLFTPFFAPDEPGDKNASKAYYYKGNNGGYSKSYKNSYIKDDFPAAKYEEVHMKQRQEFATKYNGASVSGSRGPGYGCNMQPILPLTGNKGDVLAAINSMVATGYTHVAEGVGWGLRVLSPTPPFTVGTHYNNKAIPKVMVMLTDGENTFNSESNHNGSTYTAYGFLEQKRLGSSNYNSAVNKQNQLVADACNNVKATGTIIYSFAYQVNDATAKNLIKNCATDAEKYFDPPTNAQLITYFEQIADELRGLYLSK